MVLIQHSVNSDWLLNTQSKALQAACLILENNERESSNINKPYIIDQCFYPVWLAKNLRSVS